MAVAIVASRFSCKEFTKAHPQGFLGPEDAGTHRHLFYPAKVSYHLGQPIQSSNICSHANINFLYRELHVSGAEPDIGCSGDLDG
ncbi:uncharacterized protein N7498_000012 [Penicillium cinerascens]|uniref:Uncharacterized protein n=1 Tax=Penicillium cinerascens TaxID=70096 RepID=A0A9W9NFQ0_9EURO|nr:uncharacterized protein N7498_000012 [Penicillium cinerascens]KAJ5217913.1 hypothetical protein N7498_000012 [Penicillium cinerascens]